MQDLQERAFSLASEEDRRVAVVLAPKVYEQGD